MVNDSYKKLRRNPDENTAVLQERKALGLPEKTHGSSLSTEHQPQISTETPTSVGRIGTVNQRICGELNSAVFVSDGEPKKVVL
mgnify:CR=1 FL=1